MNYGFLLLSLIFTPYLTLIDISNIRTNKCVNKECGAIFAEYHCSKCNIWMALKRKPFHCQQCGFCRVGGQENFKHCSTCSMCINVSVYDTHNCMKDKYRNACPVCREDLFSSRQAPQGKRTRSGYRINYVTSHTTK